MTQEQTLKSQPRKPSAFADPAPQISVANMDPRSAGALVIAVLAYPEAKYANSRLETAMRLAARFGLAGRQDDFRWFKSDMANGLALPVDFERLNGGSKRLEDRLRKRIDAGRLALQPIVAFERGELPRLVWGGRWNRSEALRTAAHQSGAKDVSNFNSRHWASSLPVMHIAAAWTSLIIEDEKAGRLASIEKVISDPSYLGRLLTLAERFEAAVVEQGIGARASTLLRIRGWKV